MTEGMFFHGGEEQAFEEGDFAWRCRWMKKVKGI